MKSISKKSKGLGKGHVMFNGKIMTGDDYKNAIVKTLKDNDMGWMTTPEIIHHASRNQYCEGEDYPRKAVCHPIYKMLSEMMDNDVIRVLMRVKRAGEWEYKLMDPDVRYINGHQCFVRKK